MRGHNWQKYNLTKIDLYQTHLNGCLLVGEECE